MPKLQIRKTIDINAPVEKIYEKVSDLNHWTTWSPWLIMEPDAKVTVSDDARSYEWEGKRVGKGNMNITDSKADEYVDYDLTFLSPWKSYAKVRFELKSKGNKTEVAWTMDSSLPWFMFWMKKMMTAFVGMDYQRGLYLLKDYVEDGEVHSKLEFLGESEFSGCKYLAIKTTCSMSSLSQAMSNDFEKVWSYMKKNKDLINGAAFSIYHKWDIVNGSVSYTSGVPVNEIPSDLPGDFMSGSIPQTRVYTLRHTGPYRHLGNAWGTLYNMQRGKSLKVNKKIHPFETYVNNPGEVPDNDLVTEIHFPIR